MRFHRSAPSILGQSLIALSILAAACSPADDRDEDVGSAGEVSQSLVDDVLPEVDVQKMRRHIERHAVQNSRMSSARPLVVDGLARRVGLATQSNGADSEIRSDDAVLSFDPLRNQVLATRRVDMRKSLPRPRDRSTDYADRFESVIAEMGIDRGELVFAAEPDFIVGQAFESRQDHFEPLGESSVHAVQLVARRVVDDVPVDGSRARVVFRDPDELVLADVKWPEFVLHPSVRPGMNFKSREQLAAEAAVRIGRPAVAPTVTAGVVYRPVTDDGRTYFVPSLKVAHRAGNAGEIFYVDLDVDAPEHLRPEDK
jgi:hypothetical protein